MELPLNEDLRKLIIQELPDAGGSEVHRCVNLGYEPEYKLPSPQMYSDSSSTSHLE